jgi:hypothetical protein
MHSEMNLPKKQRRATLELVLELELEEESEVIVDPGLAMVVRLDKEGRVVGVTNIRLVMAVALEGTRGGWYLEGMNRRNCTLAHVL